MPALKYVLRKLLYTLLIIWGVISLIFALFNLIPGDPARMALGQRTDSASIAAVRKDLGLDKPLWTQYGKYLNDIAPISLHNISNKSSYFYYDSSLYGKGVMLLKISNHALILKYPYLRRSYQSQKTVTSIISSTIINTLILAVAAMLFATVIGILLGILAAVTKGTLFDKSLLVFSALGMSLPSFFAAILFGWLFAYVLGNYTGLNLTGNLWEVDSYGEHVRLCLKNLILPAFTLGIRPLSVIVQLTRGSLLDTLSSDYIRTAKAKGLKFGTIIWKHALRNSLNPVVTAISGWLASLMAGVIFVEYIFGWKGLGYVMITALNSYDVPLVVGCVVTIAVIFSIINLLVDISYSILDPRVRMV
ncbi:MAG: ABC transporter permease [Bacteroidales bacterium]|nr:ABC transporter permease [Bacteroidales bacterium]HPD94847.1 ABC transporter permease [Tenuifilaceae bacterium]